MPTHFKHKSQIWSSSQVGLKTNNPWNTPYYIMYSSENQHVPWKSMVWKRISYQNSPLFRGQSLVFGSCITWKGSSETKHIHPYWNKKCWYSVHFFFVMFIQDESPTSRSFFWLISNIYCQWIVLAPAHGKPNVWSLGWIIPDFFRQLYALWNPDDASVYLRIVSMCFNGLFMGNMSCGLVCELIPNQAYWFNEAWFLEDHIFWHILVLSTHPSQDKFSQGAFCKWRMNMNMT